MTSNLKKLAIGGLAGAAGAGLASYLLLKDDGNAMVNRNASRINYIR